jgi:hypothetical protein
MTPKEKAKDLVDKFKTPVKPDESYSDYNVNHIACALIAVDEILNVIGEYIIEPMIFDIEYWQEVKKEIQIL